MSPPRGTQAAFGPIPPDLDLPVLVEQTPNFQYVVRIPCDMIEAQGMEAFEKLVLLHVIIGGKPLIVDGFHQRLNQWTFTARWLRDNMGKKFEQARNLTKQENLPLSIGHYLDNLPMLANQWDTYNYKELNRQRLYLKDIDCPPLWQDKLKEQIPPGLFYLNESTGDVGGSGAVDEPNPSGIGFRKGRGVARAGDLMSCLPLPMRADNLMCYIGHEGTYTPAHREMCASLGQNIMVETSGNIDEDGKPTKPGSSIWFMTETKDRHLVSEYWLSNLGHDIEVEAHFAHINAWRRAPFTVYVVEQNVGDFLLIPPLAPHQVWNRGTRTMKVAWNRTTVETLELALAEALPRARLVCRDEQYKNKAIVLFSLNRYSGLLKRVELQRKAATDEETRMRLYMDPKVRQLQKDFRRLFALFNQIMLSEMFSMNGPSQKNIDYLPFDSNVTCAYCRCNIFNRFLTCPSCVIPLEEGGEDTYDICMECYAMGRSCRCISKLKWVEQFPWGDLIEKHDLWRHQVIQFEGGLTEGSPQPLYLERRRMRTRSLAEVCQEQLKKRPFKDIRKNEEPEDKSEGPEDEDINEDGTVKRRKKRRNDKFIKESLPCHICGYRELLWKVAVCGCGAAYCYGSLWRGFDIMPQSVMEDPDWKCPKCRRVCTCTSCRKDPKNVPFEPTGTVLGHDTRKFADPRSIESLVDFSRSNMHWVRKAGDDNPRESRRLQRRQDEAAIEKSIDPALNEHYVEDGDLATPISDPSISNEDDIPIDPALGGSSVVRKRAVDALKVMSSLSQLEQDPDAFIASAGLSGMNGDLSLASTALMAEVCPEYPEIYDQPRSVDGLMDFRASQATVDNATSGKSGRKNGKSGPPRVQSDAPLTANDKFQMTETQKTLAEAKRNNRLISARAAMGGDKLVIRLSLPSNRLTKYPTMTQPGIPPQVSVEQQTEQDSAATVQPDLPKGVSEGIAKTRNPQVQKKRLRDEADEDFTTQPSRDRRSGAKVIESKKGRLFYQVPELSDSDLELELQEQSSRIINADTAKRRSLPAYLARRISAADAEPPKQLATNGRRKSSQPKANGTIDGNMPRPAKTRTGAVEAAASHVTAVSMAEANRRAKLKAAGYAISTSGTESDDSLIAKPAQKKPKCTDAEPVSKQAKSTSTKPSPMAPNAQRKSIFSQRGRGKIKITSARNATKGGDGVSRKPGL